MRPLVAILAVVLAGCNMLPLEQSHAPDPPPLAMMNSTDLQLVLVVNGVEVGSFAPGTGTTIEEEALPKLPWEVEVRTHASGRLVATMPVGVGSVTWKTDADGRITESSGTFLRLDLSCGRLEVWSAPEQPQGPPPDPNAVPDPGDCDP